MAVAVEVGEFPAEGVAVEGFVEGGAAGEGCWEEGGGEGFGGGGGFL